MTPSKNNTPIDDNTLNQTLARLTTVDIPDGLEQRLLATLATHTTNYSAATHTAAPATTQHHQPLPAARLHWPWLHRPFTPTTIGLSGLTFAALVLTITSLRHNASSSASPRHSIQAAQPNRTPSQTHAASATETLSPPGSETQLAATRNSASDKPRNHNTAAAKSTPSISTNPDSTHANRVNTGFTDADLALAETLAPSQLAPKLPLTKDERTLLQLAKRSTP